MRYEHDDPPPETCFRRWHHYREYWVVFRLTFPSQIFWLVVYLLAFLVFAPKVMGEEGHELHHPVYVDWVSKEGRSCCNNQDCRPLKDSEVRYVDGQPEMKIEASWCPVQPKHYLKTGKSPDWEKAHGCVQLVVNYEYAPATKDESPCWRLLCFTPKGGF